VVDETVTPLLGAQHADHFAEMICKDLLPLSQRVTFDALKRRLLNFYPPDRLLFSDMT